MANFRRLLSRTENAGFRESPYFFLQVTSTVFIGALTVATILRLVRISLAGGNSWITGDWLIKYSGGYVRRGLVGEVAWSISSFSGMSLLWVVALLQILSFLAFVVFSFLLFRRTNRDLTSLLMFVSPAFLAFHFWDLQGGFRKEILMLGVFAYLLWQSTKEVRRPTSKFFLLGAWALLPAVSGFIHEALVFFSPIMAITLWIVRQRIGVTVRPILITIAIGGVLAWAPLAMSVLYPGTAEQADLICSDVTSTGLDSSICGGAISAIGWTIDDAFAVVRDSANLNYGFLALMALLPFILKKPHCSLVFSVGIASTALVPIFLIGADWGRWIHILVSILTLTFFGSRSIRFEKIDRQPPLWLASLVVGIFSFGWHLPHFAPSNWGPGILELLPSVLSAISP